MKKNILKRVGILVMAAAIGIGAAGCGKEDTQNAAEESTGNVTEKTDADEAEQAKTTEEGNAPSGDAAEKLVIHIGDQPPVLPVKIAELNGYFAEELGENVEIEITQFSSGPSIVEGYMADQVDFAISGDAPIIQGIAGGADVKIIAAPAESDKASGLVATEASGIKELSDIKGKKVGVTLGSTYHQLLLIYLDSLGLTTDDIQIVNVPTAEAMTALETENIDAAILNMQNINTAVDKGIAHLVATSEGYKYGIVAVSARTEFADAHPEAVSGFLRALKRATEYIAENPEEAVKLVAAETGIEEKDLLANVELQDYVFDFSQRKQDSVQQSVEFAYQAELINKELTLEDVVDTSYLEAAGLAE